MALQRRGRTAHLTKSFVDGLSPSGLAVAGQPPKDVVIWDQKQPGFCLKVTKGASKTFWAVGRAPGAPNATWIKIGSASGRYDPEKLRGQAADRLSELRNGKNANVALRQARNAKTLDAYSVSYFEQISAKRKPRTAHDYHLQYINRIQPRFGRTVLAEISHDDIARWHASIAKAHPYLANRCLALLRAMLNAAGKSGSLPGGTNPCNGISLARESNRERFLSEAERKRLNAALSAFEAAGYVYAVAAIRLLIATGARRNEILTLKWDYVSFDRGLIELPDSKTGGKPIILSSQAMELLRQIPRQKDNPFVIAGRRPGAALTDLEKPWQRIRQAGGLDDVRLHDLRHSYASTAVMNGVPLAILGKLLGHKDVKTTQRYAHIADNALRQAAELAVASVGVTSESQA